MMTRESLAFWFANVSFGATGVLMVLILQWEDYQGIGNREAAITLLANFLGQAIVCSPALFIEQSPRRRYSHVFWWLALTNVIGEAAAQACIGLVGSGVYIILYSSVTIWAAIIKFKVYSVPLSTMQWGSLLVIFLGLCVQAGGNSNSRASGGDTLLGIALGVISALVYAVYYVSADALLCGKFEEDKNQETAPSPLVTFAFVGMVNSCWCGTYVAMYTGYNWERLISAPVREAGGDYWGIIVMYILLLLMFGMHLAAFGYVLKGSGAVSAGVNKALQAISIFAFSSMFFCDEHPDQCLSLLKLVSMVLVIIGVLWYAHATGEAKALEEEAARSEQGWANHYSADMTPTFLEESFQSFLYRIDDAEGSAAGVPEAAPRFMRSGEASLLAPTESPASNC